MITSVSSDKNLRFSQLLGGAVGPNVVIGQFESTGDANNMMFSTRSKTVVVCWRGSWWWKPLGSLSSRATAPHRRQSSALHQSLSTFWSPQQSQAWLSFSIISSAEDGGTTWITSKSRLLVIKIFLTSSHSMSEPGQEEQKPSLCFASIVNLFFPQTIFFSYFVFAYLNIRWPKLWIDAKNVNFVLLA